MKSAMDSAGRVLIPSELRRRASLSPGSELDVSWEDGRIVLEPRPLEVKLVKRGRFVVAEAQENVPPMPAEAVDSVIAELRSKARK